VMRNEKLKDKRKADQDGIYFFGNPQNLFRRLLDIYHVD